MSKLKNKVSADARPYRFERQSWGFDYGSLEERLICEVKKETVLYDKQCTAYRRTEATEEAWKRVSDALGATVDFCKKRWKSLRDCFIKHYRAALISKQQPNKKSWAYYDHLSFLSKHIQLYRVGDYDFYKSESVHTSQDAMAADMLAQDTMDSENALRTDEASSETHFEEHFEIEEVDEESVRTLSKAMSPLATRSYMPNEQHHQVLLSSTTNSNERFLLSCAPALERLSKRKNALARLKIQKLLYEMEFGDEDDVDKELPQKKTKLS